MTETKFAGPKDFIFYFVTFFGTGLSPKAPGTVGTLAALPLIWAIFHVGPLVYMASVLLLALTAIFACQIYESRSGRHDQPEIVIDEVLGIMIAMTWLPMTWQSFVAAFVLFRILDIWKPFPIGYLDQRIPGGVGVIADDVAAGLITNIVLQVVLNQTNWLGIQIG
jgi:phosphatidylglycerophosphatase A